MNSSIGRVEWPIVKTSKSAFRGALFFRVTRGACLGRIFEGIAFVRAMLHPMDVGPLDRFRRDAAAPTIGGSALSLLGARVGSWVLLGRQKRRLAQKRVLGQMLLMGQGIEPRRVGRRQRCHALDAIAVRPPHVVWPLPGGLHEIAQEILIGVG